MSPSSRKITLFVTDINADISDAIKFWSSDTHIIKGHPFLATIISLEFLLLTAMA